MGKKPIPNNLFIAFVYKYDVLGKNIVIIERQSRTITNCLRSLNWAILFTNCSSFDKGGWKVDKLPLRSTLKFCGNMKIP